VSVLTVFPDIVKDSPKMRNLLKIFLRSFENVVPDVYVWRYAVLVVLDRTEEENSNFQLCYNGHVTASAHRGGDWSDEVVDAVGAQLFAGDHVTHQVLPGRQRHRLRVTDGLG